jgi:hypothetical protein
MKNSKTKQNDNLTMNEKICHKANEFFETCVC